MRRATKAEVRLEGKPAVASAARQPTHSTRGTLAPVAGMPVESASPGSSHTWSHVLSEGAPIRDMSNERELPSLRAEDRRMDIEAWLQGLGLGRYVPAFRDNEIDGEVLPKLTSEDLREIGVARAGTVSISDAMVR